MLNSSLGELRREHARLTGAYHELEEQCDEVMTENEALKAENKKLHQHIVKLDEIIDSVDWASID